MKNLFRFLLQGHASLCRFIQVYASRFIQVHAIIMLAYYCYFFYSLPREFSANLYSRCSSSSLPSLGPRYSSFTTFQPGLSLCQEEASTSKKVNPNKLRHPSLFPYIGLSDTDEISCSSSLRCEKVSHESGSC